MSKANTAAAWAEAIAYDDSHGYDQANRWGPDLDCSSLTILAYEKAGVPVKSRGATYTGNMRRVFLECGFSDVTAQIDLGSGAGLVRGDVLLNERSHTAICLGGGRIVNASGNEFGGAVGGMTGDQTGREIAVIGYYNFPWDCVLRYMEKSTEEGAAGGASSAPANAHTAANTYVVKSGDTLTAIAARLGVELAALIRENGITDPNRIFPGHVLKIPGKDSSPAADTGDPNDKKEAAEHNDRPGTYTVRNGDTLTAIAARLGVELAALILENGITDPNWIFPGQVLKIPGYDPSPAAAAKEKNASAPRPAADAGRQDDSRTISITVKALTLERLKQRAGELGIGEYLDRIIQ